MTWITSFLSLITNAAVAQIKLPVPLNAQRLYDKGYRSTDGKPGKNYWQNSADYNIAVNYNPVTRLVSGTEEITYINNSPDVLNEIVFKLYPNIYKKGSPRLMAIEDEKKYCASKNLVVFDNTAL